LANIRAYWGRRDISHAGRQKVTDEDTLQNRAAGIMTNRVKETLEPGEAIVRLAFLVTRIFDSWASTSAEALR